MKPKEDKKGFWTWLLDFLAAKQDEECERTVDCCRCGARIYVSERAFRRGARLICHKCERNHED
jgi:hypothetical protein